MFKVGICLEDETKREELETEITKWRMKSGLQIALWTYANGETFACQMTNGKSPDVLFFDVCHDSERTQRALMEYRKRNQNTRFVNVGALNAEDKSRLQDLQPVSISYPLDKGQVYELAKREYRRYYSDDESYVFLHRPKYVKLSLKKVVHFSSVQRKVRAVCEDGTVHEFYRQLDCVEEELRDKRIKFIRTHQSHLVNPEFIKGYYGNEILLKSGEKLTVAATRRKRVRLAFKALNIRR